MQTNYPPDSSKKKLKRRASWLRFLGLAPMVYSSTLVNCFTSAQEMVRITGQEQCTNLHMLLALMHSGKGIAQQVLRHLNCCDANTIDEVTKLAKLHQHGCREDKLTFGREFKIMLALAGRAAKRRKEYFVGTHHVLYAMSQRNNSCTMFLSEHGITENTISETLKQLGEHGELVD